MRVLAICIFLLALRESTKFFGMIFGGDYDHINLPQWIYLASTSLSMIIAIILWFFPLSLARSLVREDFDHEIQPINSTNMLAAMIAVIGLFTFYYAFSDALYWLVYSNFAAKNPDAIDTNSLSHFSDRANAIVTVVELVVSVLLAFKSKAIASYIMREAE